METWDNPVGPVGDVPATRVQPARILPIPEEYTSRVSSELAVPLPDFLKGKGYTVIDSGNLVPMAEFKAPGEYVAGWFHERRDNIGPNASRQYHIKIGPDEIIGIWGCTILDAKMDKAAPARGQSIVIQYLGDVNTSRDQNQAHDFRVIVGKGK